MEHLHHFAPDFNKPPKIRPDEKCLENNCEFRIRDTQEACKRFDPTIVLRPVSTL